MISLSRQSTRIALMPAVIKGLRDGRSAETGLARPARVNLDEITPGALSLGRDFIHEGSPPGIIDGLCQHSFGEPSDIQIFHGDQAVIINQLSRLFMMKVR